MKKTLLIIALMGISTYSYTNSGGHLLEKAVHPEITDRLVPAAIATARAVLWAVKSSALCPQ